MNELYSSLLKLQEIDQEISQAENRLNALTPRITELRSPLNTIEQESADTRAHLEKLRHQVRKLEHGADNKRQRLKAFEEKAQKSRRHDEAAVRAEMDLIRGAVEAEVAELDETNLQLRRTDMKLEDLARNAGKVESDIAPQLAEIEFSGDRYRSGHSHKVDQIKLLIALDLYFWLFGAGSHEIGVMAETGRHGAGILVFEGKRPNEIGFV